LDIQSEASSSQCLLPRVMHEGLKNLSCVPPNHMRKLIVEGDHCLIPLVLLGMEVLLLHVYNLSCP
jgi:hypothetical protein